MLLSKNAKIPSMHCQPRAPRKRSVPSVNDQPAIVDIFRKFYENGPCIQTISFRVTMILWKIIKSSYLIPFTNTVKHSVNLSLSRNLLF